MAARQPLKKCCATRSYLIHTTCHEEPGIHRPHTRTLVRPGPAQAPLRRLTPDRQRAFIHALAETGSIKAAAKRINMSSEGAYALRRQPDADGFRAAWDAALDHGVQNFADIAIARAIEGVPVPIFYEGEQIGERVTPSSGARTRPAII